MNVPAYAVIALCAGALFYFGVTSNWGEASRAEAQTVDQMAQGQQVYADNCQVCHGQSRISDGSTPDLRRFSRGEEAFRTMLAEGFYPMPSFAGELEEDEILALWAYVASEDETAAE